MSSSTFLTSLSVKSIRLDFSSSSVSSFDCNCSSSLSPSSLNTFTSSVLPKSSPGDDGAADEVAAAPPLWFVCGILLLIAPQLLTFITFGTIVSDGPPSVGDSWCLTAIAALDIRSTCSILQYSLVIFTFASLSLQFILSGEFIFSSLFPFPGDSTFKPAHFSLTFLIYCTHSMFFFSTKLPLNHHNLQLKMKIKLKKLKTIFSKIINCVKRIHIPR